jgi:N-acetylhexosamine 1-kinase
MTVEDDAGAVAATFVDAVRSTRRFGGGHINDTFLVDARSGEYVLQKLNTGVFHDAGAVKRNIALVSAHLNGRLVPELVHADGAWRMWRRVPGAATVSRVTVAQAASAGQLLGRFHAPVADLDPTGLTEPLPNFHDPARRLAALQRAVTADVRARTRTVRDEIETLFAAAPLAEQARVLTDAVPRRVAHYDAKLDNVLFRGDEAVALVDLDTVMPGAWFWDLGDLLRTAAATAPEDDPEHSTIDAQLYDATLASYCDAASGVLDPAEADALEDAGAIVTFEQAVRFLTDWLEGDVYYRTARPDQNLDRARSQLRLLAAMPTTVRWS